jgi:hypothetical protein
VPLRLVRHKRYRSPVTHTILLDGSMRIENHEGFVKVWHNRPAQDIPELETILSSIDASLVTADTSCVLFDSRESEYRAGEVQARMWDWLQNHAQLQRVATLVTSELLATSVNMTGVSRAVKIKAFATEDEAIAWLHKR